MTTTCGQCGFNNPPGMRFCGNCGARLEPGSAAPVEGVPEPAPLIPGISVMMGADLEERLRKAGIEASGQRRNVTVLFADISGYTPLSQLIDGEDLFDLVQQFVGVLSNNVYKYEGIIDKLTGDGLMALFGAPISHENNAERAVRAALDMQNDLQQLSRKLHQEIGVEINVRIGLHSGAVVVGGIGSNLMMNYTAIGDTVNLARRIEEAAPVGSILISEAVHRLVRSLFDCQQISILNPKGIAHPVVAFRVTGAKTRPGPTRGLEGLYAPMIGRDQELLELKQAATDLIARKQGQFVLITGEAGLGKTRLTNEFKVFLEQRSVWVLEGSSLAYRRVPYWIFREALYSFLGLPTGTSPQQTSERLTHSINQLMGDQASDALPYLEHLLSLPYSDPAAADRLEHLEAGQLRQQIFLTVRDVLLKQASERPLVIILDDLHWADDASLELLLYLLEALRQEPIFILANSRLITTGLMEKVVNWATQNLGARFHSIKLQSLSPDQSKQLLYLLLSISDLAEKLREQILLRAAGIPFYLEEILRMLIDSNVIQNEEGQWRVTPDSDSMEASLGVPDTLQELILTRFDRLEVVQRQALQIASVIGKDFSLELLSAVTPTLGRQDVHDVINELVERAFILPQASSPESEFTFRHILMSDAIYSTILRKDRSRLHGEVAEAIEQMAADRLEDQVELLANHFRWSPRLDKALYYLIWSGKKAERNNVNEQARDHYEAALGLLEQTEHTPYQVFQVHMGLGNTGVFVSAYPEAREHYLLALQAFQEEDSSRYAQERSALRRMIARTFERQGDYDQALVSLSLAQQALDASAASDPVEQAQVWNDIGWISFRRRNFAEAQDLLQRALDLVEDSDAYDVIASIYNRLGGLAYNQGDWGHAADFLRKSISIREAIRDVVGLATSFNNLGLLRVEMGEFDRALENLTRSYELKTRLGQPEGIAMALNNLGWLRIQRGEFDEGRQALIDALEMARVIGYSSLHREILKNLGELHLAAQEWEQAKEVLSEMTQSLMGVGANDQLVDAYRQLGEASLGAGDLEVAEAWAGKAQDLIQSMADPSDELSAVQRGELHRFLGMLDTRRGDWEAAYKHLSESLALFEKLRSRLYQGRAAYQLGVLAEAQCDQAAADKYYSQATALFHSVGARTEGRRAENAKKRRTHRP